MFVGQDGGQRHGRERLEEGEEGNDRDRVSIKKERNKEVQWRKTVIAEWKNQKKVVVGVGGVHKKQSENKGWLYQQRNVLPADIM